MSDISNLIKIEKKQIPEVFTSNGLQPYIELINKEVSGLVPDTSTDKGRKEIASLAHKVSKSKTYLDGIGKEYVAELKQLPKTVDAERKRMRDILDELKDKTRLPLTEWEEKEEARKKNILNSIEEISILKTTQYYQSEDIQSAIVKAEAFEINDSLEEFEGHAENVKNEVLLHLKAAFIVMDTEEKEAVRLAKEKAERIEKERIEREEKLKAEAAAKAKKEAEENARAEIEAAKQKEIEAQKAIKRAEEEKIKAAKQAEKDKQEAIKAERIRAEAEKQAEIEAAAKREADKKHRAKINNAALKAISKLGLSDTHSKKIVEAIAKGMIPNISISY